MTFLKQSIRQDLRSLTTFVNDNKLTGGDNIDITNQIISAVNPLPIAQKYMFRVTGDYSIQTFVNEMVLAYNNLTDSRCYCVPSETAYDVTSSSYTVPITGYWNLTYRLAVDGGSLNANARVAMCVNGVAKSRSGDTLSSIEFFQDTLYLMAGDVLDVRCVQADANLTFIINPFGGSFSGELISNGKFTAGTGITIDSLNVISATATESNMTVSSPLSIDENDNITIDLTEKQDIITPTTDLILKNMIIEKNLLINKKLEIIGATKFHGPITFDDTLDVSKIIIYPETGDIIFGGPVHYRVLIQFWIT
jgi:hypothetical protein